MEFVLAKSGTITDCREALNGKIREVSTPAHTEYESVVRSIASYVVQELLDPPHSIWADQVNKCRAVGMALPVEPKCAFSITCVIELEHPE